MAKRSRSQRRSRTQQQQKARTQRRGIGGCWASVLETAIVPLSLLGLQQSFRRKTNKKR